MTHMLSEILEQPAVLAGIEKQNGPVLKALVEEIRRRDVRHVVFAGRGTSDHASIYGGYLLSIYCGLVTALAMPSCITLYNSNIDYGNDLVVGVSQSGCAADALAVLEQAKRGGAVTVAVTNDPDSPMAKAAKYHLYCAAGPEISVAATKTFTAQMYLLALLAAGWSANRELLGALRRVPEAAVHLLETGQEQICKQAERFRDITGGFVLSRGISYPIALEAALKVQETCGIRMKGYAGSDFYHGPLAQAGAGTPVILMAPLGRALEDIKALLKRLAEIGVSPLVVTNDAGLAAGGPYDSITLPDAGSEAAQAFLFTLFAQLFAQHLAVSRGFDPDSPLLLKKVTVTR